jgi:mono/diheme cytochrome c family protein
MRCVLAGFAAAALIAVTGSASIALGAAGLQKAMAKPVASSPASIKEGARTYAVWCRSCHGLRAKGDGITAPPGAKPANLTDAEWKHGSTDAEIFRNIKEGIAPREFMKPQKDNLSDAEIWNVVNYIRSLAQTAKQ